MSTLSYSTLESLWTEAGGPSSVAPVAAAIAIAESGGNPAAVGPTWNGDAGSIGLWQIQTGAHPQWTVAQLENPQTNAQAAVSIYQAAGNAFTPWSTYTEGTYLKYLNGADYSGSGQVANLTSATTSADRVRKGTFTMPGISIMGQQVGNFDLDGVVGACAIVGGAVVMMAGSLVLMATVFKGPIKQAAELYPPIKAISMVAGRSGGGRRESKSARLPQPLRLPPARPARRSP